MKSGSPAEVIGPIGHAELDAFMGYLEDQMADNGQNGTPLFQPSPRGAPWISSDKVGPFRLGIDIPVGQPRWRRSWCAHDDSGAIIGHVDLRAHDESLTSHRALLGMGVDRAHRRRGLGGALVRHALGWAQHATTLEWIDLSFLGGNLPAERLYRSVGFTVVGTVPDRFRIDGLPVDEISMARRIDR